jgi:hypothetical protein
LEDVNWTPSSADARVAAECLFGVADLKSDADELQAEGRN